jgi:TolB-like protein
MSYKGTHKSLPQIAKELSVDGIVEGSVIRSAERVRVTAQLIYAPEDKHIWAQTFDSSARDVLSIESELAQSIAKAVQVHMGSSSPRAASRSRPVNPDAHDAYLRGRYFWNQRRE